MRSYSLIKVKKFPNISDVSEDGIKTTHQIPLPGMNGDATAHTIFKKLGLSENESFEKYKIDHEDLKSIEARLWGRTINNIIAIEHLFAHYKRDQKLLIISGKSKTWWKACERLHIAYPDLFDMDKPEIDLSILRKAIESRVIGGYFNELNIANVKAASIFGSRVEESDEWERYEDSGELTALLISIDHHGIPRSIMITREKVVVLYSPPNELKDLEFLLAVDEMITKAAALMEKENEKET